MNETCSACGLPFKTDAMESRTLLPDGSHVHEATATSPDSMSRCRAALVARITTLEARLEKVLAVGSPWPLRDVLAKLVSATEHLLQDHACDVHGHEEMKRAADEARCTLQRLEEP